jgi:hypothetical protein
VELLWKFDNILIYVSLCFHVFLLIIIYFVQVLQAVLSMYSVPEHLFAEVCVIVDKVRPNPANDFEHIHC